MFGKTLIVLFALALFSIVSPAQNTGTGKLTQWEYLEISGTKYSSGYDQITRYYRDYNYLTSATVFSGQNSLEWMKDSGWELVSVVNSGESPVSLFFKRPFNKARTENEIARLKKDYETETSVAKKSAPNFLADLDELEFNRNLVAFNKNEEVKLRSELEQIKNPPFKVIGVQSNSRQLDRPVIGAEIVLDATAVLLKDGKNYRSSEADKYFRDAATQIAAALKLTPDSYNSNALRGNAREISRGLLKPSPIGKLDQIYAEINLKISIVITVNNQQNIVAQGFIYGQRIKEKKAN